jgi:hypothetical protein
MLSEAELSGDDKKVERRLTILIRAHTQKQHFSRLKQIFKPNSTGGLSYILVPENFSIDQYPYEPTAVQRWESVHDHDMLQTFIQKRNLQHFGQAQGTPFTTDPLNKFLLAGQQCRSKRSNPRLNSNSASNRQSASRTNTQIHR